MLGSNLKDNPTVGPVAGKRPKVALQPGRSLMDWVRLGLSGKDLQGQGGKIRKVTKEELNQHNTEDDCWMLLRGKVYNITAYLEYHPGGIPELMQGAGKDATHLFDEIHKWVNIESMLGKCLIGPIDTSPTKHSLEPLLPKVSVQQAPYLPSKGDVEKTNNKKSIPRYEWYQNEDSITLSIYAKDKDITENNLIADCSNGKTLNCKVLFPKRYYQLHLVGLLQLNLLGRNQLAETDPTLTELENSVSDLEVKPTRAGSGKIELQLQKSISNKKWSSLGTKLENHGELLDEKHRDLARHRSYVSAIKQISPDTKLFSLKLPNMTYFKCPIGHHVLIEQEIHGIVIGKNYTVVLESLDDEHGNNEKINSESCQLHLMIKIYEDGTITPVLDDLQVGDLVTISDPIGSFTLSRLKRAKSVYMISAGTGLTPMIRIMDYIARNREIERKMHLLFGNRYEKDILWRNELDDFCGKNQDMMDVRYILSRPPDGWTGLRGRINQDVLNEVLGSIDRPSAEEELLICICGPDEFTEAIKRCLLAMQFTDQMIHCFLG